MASITILPGNTNLWIAQAIARDNADAKVIESTHGITVRAKGKLEIERVTVEDAAGCPADRARVWQVRQRYSRRPAGKRPAELRL